MERDNDFFSFMSMPKELVTFNRPIRLKLDLPGGINDDMLLPQRVFGTETLCGGIDYRILCVSSNATLPLKQLIAVPAALQFVTDQGDLRSVCGIVTEASSGDSDGGLASYQLVLRDALAILEKRINTRVFRQMDEVEIVRQILLEWRHKSSTLGVCFTDEVDEAFHLQEYPKREFTMQHNESDAAFIRRLLKRSGIGWYVRAEANGDVPTHTLVLFNSADSLRQNVAGTIRYHRDAGTEQRDTITSWGAVRSLQPGVVTRHSWDYRYSQGPDYMMAQASSGVDQGVSGNELAASLDDYQVMMPHAGDDVDDLCRLGKLHMTRHDFESKCFHGEGSVRDLCAGEYFTLSGHPEVDQHPREERDFVVTALQVNAQNNLPKALAERVERLFSRSRWTQGAQEPQVQKDVADRMALGALRMHIQFTAVRRGVKIVPAYDARTDLPQALMQSAIVVGPKGEEVYCDQMGRVKIRFPGTRAADHVHADGSGAAGDDGDSAWVRVASNWAGNGPGSVAQCGTIGLPRVGTEVLVNFLGGDPDKPVIVGQIYNQQAQPPALSDQGDLPGNRYLSGIKSREIKGSRTNQLRFDDTQGEISAQLSSDHGTSQLNLGFLTQPKNQGYGEPRGEGAELRSELAVAVRGAEGVLITAEAGGGNSGKQLDRAELTRVSRGVKTLAGQLSKLAEKFTQENPRSEELGQLVEAVQQLETTASRIVALNGPAGVAIGSGLHVLIGAAAGVDVVSSEDTYLSSGGKTVILSSRGTSLFANQGDMKINAASGKVQIQAQNEALQMLANKVLEIISTTDWINIRARKGVRINGGGTELVLSADGIKGYTDGKHEMHAADHQTMGASSRKAEFPGSKTCATRAAGAAQSGESSVPLE
ncbi:type VI secretion system Vgr family protein [Burkholderia sp. LMU1-1-1.1]|uniref:type VI secretion system Vgr family protein n=1 Tax=Burkholderia sp. LMU1-1-1.1 TaxID=3135266 RepID=UPI0034286A25